MNQFNQLDAQSELSALAKITTEDLGDYAERMRILREQSDCSPATCAKCGGQAFPSEASETKANYVKCGQCGRHTSLRWSIEAAIDEWNDWQGAESRGENPNAGQASSKARW